MTRASVVTLARGRHAHLERQQRGLLASTRAPDDYVVVAMGDPEIRERFPLDGLDGVVLDVPVPGGGLPLAAARNAGARLAIDRGADVLVFLDVDCIPAPGLVAEYARVAQDGAWSGRLLCGPVTYLDPPGPSGYVLERLPDLDAPHPARPAPEPGDVVAGDSPDLFWSLSFAVTRATWERVGGFPEVYEGYGGEDTDFGRVAQSRGVDLAWVGGARAYHQWHPTQSPPLQHLHDIARNANLFHDRWGSWPMGGWLQQFRDLGLMTGGIGDHPCVVTSGTSQVRS